jgi:MSHA biogenesis protein MshE
MPEKPHTNDILKNKKAVSNWQLEVCNTLLNKKLITREQLEAAIKKQQEVGRKLGDLLIESGAIDERTFLQFLAQQIKLPYVELAHYAVDPRIAHLLPESYARHFRAILLADEDKRYFVGMVDPMDIFATDELYSIFKKPLKLALISEKELLYTLDQVYRRTDEITGYAGRLASELQAPSEATTGEKTIRQTDPVVSRLLHSIFEDAVQVGASDIHIEPAENILRIRLRVDGLLQEQVIPLQGKNEIPLALAQSLKLMAGLNIAERRLPQDGRFETVVHEAKIDIRLSTMPNQHGEAIVMRLLNKTNKLLDLNTTGMPEVMLARFRKLIKSPHGIILITGPTGSGKTTTIYGALTEINEVTKNIITIEDPIEYNLERANQTQVNSQIGLTFAAILRSVLRQDPNIILVGEIRDQETASIALRAALTGQLVFATLHTNDATSTAIRLIDIGVESYLVASTVRAILAQRLVRRICSYCATPYKPTEQEIILCSTLFKGSLKQGNFSYGSGCTHCNYSGFKGRIGVFELLELDYEMREALRINDTNKFVQAVAKNRTSPDLLASTFELACQGTIALSEVMGIVGERF